MSASSRRLRIGLVTSSAPGDVRAFSGITWFMQRALEQHVGDVHCLGPARAGATALVGRLRNMLGRPFNRRYDWRHSNALARAYRDHFERVVHGFDVLVAPAAATELALLPPTSAPVVYVADATFALLNGYYPEFSRLGARNTRVAHDIERRALERATAVVYSSRWAADSAVRDYGIARDKISVIPFGANLPSAPTEADALQAKRRDVTNLLLIGVNWSRKGGDVAVAATDELRRRGWNAQLTILGCTPPSRVPPFVRTVPFLDKFIGAQATQYRDTLLDTHVVVLPTRADCSPVAIAEASAFGVPSLVTDTGGVRGMLFEGQNGFVVPIGATAADWADAIIRVLNTGDSYRALCASARATFDARLNWNAWAREFQRVIDAAIGRAQPNVIDS
jgi:glycosyltransferase involved in cell wall biosynthesis